MSATQVLSKTWKTCSGRVCRLPSQGRGAMEVTAAPAASATDNRLSRPAIPAILAQHAEDAMVIHAMRTAHTHDPHVKLEQLGRCDERIAAHLDGLAVAGNGAHTFVQALLETPSASAVFVAGVLAIGARQLETLDHLHALAGAEPSAGRGLRAAFGWVEPRQLRGLVADALASPDPRRRLVGIAASAMHRVDPGLLAARRLDDPDPQVRARAMRTAGELGQLDAATRLASTSADEDAACRFWGAWSAVLLGDRQRLLAQLRSVALDPGPFQQRALDLALLASDMAACRDLLRNFSSDPARQRLLFRGIGLMGDPALIPWLIERMDDEATARQAGEAFSLITGTDLAWLDLERKPPESIETGPGDDAGDEEVGLDEDENLPWPDSNRIRRWWEAGARHFAAGERYFLGQPVTAGGCIEALRSGFQRQRIVAALHLSLLQPGRPLFEWRAPEWRQRRALITLQESQA